MYRNIPGALFPFILFLPGLSFAAPLVPEFTPTEVIDGGDVGIFNVVCDYSHTLADDAIVMPGLPGLSMVHDFFGNRGADAMSTATSLQAAPMTTCTSPYDASSYWAPQLKRADGSIVAPSYIKVYYRNEMPARQAAAPLPMGLQLLAGNHHRPQGHYDPNIWFYCRTSLEGGEHSNAPPESCPQIADFDEGAEFNISLTFPDCWDGKNLTTSPQKRNATYSDGDTGLCPAAYPVKIPRLNMRIHYALGDNGNLKGAMLSMNPILQADGSWQPTWGNLYSAHADFFAAWSERATRYSVEECLNRNVACNKDIPGDFERSSMDAWVSVADGRMHGDEPMIKVGGAKNIGLLKFPLPERLDSLNVTKAELRIYGRQVSGETGQVRLYSLPDSPWDENSGSTDIKSCPETAHVDNAQMWRDTVEKTFDVTAAIMQAVQAGQRDISFCMSGGEATDAEFSGKEGPRGPLLRFDFDPINHHQQH
ncbi:DUF1996 domain-containing protein [Serratia quinivorans]|jgi:hypothetical protein|uniref:DUF1996 domain-containing protein n=1 Tax=Serratia quinivorans TaxID=137545 RepID=UPI00217839E3|nr:DUF1996 domain-containing protein [Serratia quinivorans]CAI0996685.1 Domain of uncharacterised function (DUF1996) [Serratia quinivorans]CAI1011397.1 Domain of uncharacterised function (DUF1996) [Serratia quinivorans]CAI1123968.1 Domain of uncharacterised function (DUF1996) [Serratia quinivorans]CAI2121153.1 Domain of uncharacterised function (DUF1996) [Serratia quinivorans]